MSGTSQIVADAMMGNVDKDVAICRIACNTAASTRIFCKCDRVLEQTTMVVCTVKTPARRVCIPLCASCWEKEQKAIFEGAELTQTPILIEGWNGVIFTQGEVD